MRPSIDLLSQYCVHAEYPVWRANLAKHRDKFNKVILYPNEYYRDLDFKEFSQKVLPETWVKDHVIDWTTPGIDWRQAEVEPMLDLVESEWIYFNEQDLFVKDWDKFYEAVFKAMGDGADAIGWMNPTHFPYLHPACFFVKKEWLDKTNLDFRAHSEVNGGDHFCMITKDLKELGAKIVTLEDLGFKYWEDYFHLGGVTGNIVDSTNPGFQFHRPDIFYVYNWWSRKADIEQSPEFLQLSLDIEKRLLDQYPELKDINPETSEWAIFFKT